MAGDPFSSHPYPGMKQIVAINYYCQICDKVMKTQDKMSHNRGKKHAEKVAELNDATKQFPAPGAAPNSDKACHKCGQHDHISRDCTQPRKDTRECHLCHQVGHAKADCRTKERSMCFNCGEEGHRKSECTKERQMICRNCDLPGHQAKECTAPFNPANVKCRNCEAMGHMAKDCPEPKDWSKVKCNNCGEMGHTSVRCKAEPGDVSTSGWENTNPSATTAPFWEDGQKEGLIPGSSWEDSLAAPVVAPSKSWDDTIDEDVIANNTATADNSWDAADVPTNAVAAW